ncbi:MAG: hypothetical protein LUI06_03025 [Ruminococcus sp.]|nr:hypothetical protein [Ruminococcus sp.]
MKLIKGDTPPMHNSPTIPLILLVMLATLSGCGKNENTKDNSVEMVEASSATSNEAIDEAIEAIDTTEFENITLGDFENNVAQADGVDVIAFGNADSNDDFLASFKSISCSISDLDYDEDKLYFSSDDLSDDDCFSENINAHKYSTHKEEIESESISVIQYIYIDEENMLAFYLATDYSGSAFTYVNDESLEAYFTEETGATFYNWSPTLDGLSFYKGYSNESEAIGFVDESQSLSNAQEKVNDFLEKLEPQLKDGYSLTIDNEQIYIDENIESELLVSNLNSCYKGIPFESVNSDTLIDGFDENSYSLSLRLRCVSATSNGVCSFIGELPNKTIETKRTLDKIVSPKSAIEAACGDLTGATEFILTDLRLSYLKNADESEIMPFWRMAFDNQNNNTTIIYLINCESGEAVTYQDDEG